MRSCRNSHHAALLHAPALLARLSLLTLLLCVASAYATVQDPATIARAHLLNAAKAQFPAATRIDVQLRSGDGAGLPLCSAPLSVDARGQRFQGNVSVAVACAGSPGWTTHIAAQVRVFVPVVVLLAPLERGDLLSAAQLQIEERELTGSTASYFVAIAQVVGQQARQRLRAGQVVAPAQLERPLLVNRGDRVALHAGDSEFQISVAAEALQSGHQGEQIRVRNLSSGRIVAGWVDSTGSVDTHPPRG